jgi:hypothetical protein
VVLGPVLICAFTEGQLIAGCAHPCCTQIIKTTETKNKIFFIIFF